MPEGEGVGEVGEVRRGDADRDTRETPAVEARSLTRSFGDFLAVDRVSFTVHPGEIFGFLGPNGAGKTTTIRMLTGLLAPTAGEGWVDGLDLRTDRREVRTRIGYMSQRFSLYGDLTVDENIELFAGLYGVTGTRFRARRDWILEMAGLAGGEGRLTAELPLGWKQRLALGCAVLHQPSILFLDEPTSGVDPLARARFWELIAALAREGTTVFVSTHYMEEAEHCNRLALMNRGRLIALDTPTALIRGMTEPLLRVRTDDPPAAVRALSGAPGVVDAAMFGRLLHVEASDAAVATATIRETLLAAGLRCHAVDRISPSLEDVFVALIRREGGAAEG